VDLQEPTENKTHGDRGAEQTHRELQFESPQHGAGEQHLQDHLRLRHRGKLAKRDVSECVVHSYGYNYLFAGEQFDPDLGLYYNRASYS
jgi:hypothetical protein